MRPPRRSCGWGTGGVGAIFGPRNASTAEQRELALREALDHRGLNIPTQLSVRGPFDFETGFRGATELLQREPRPTVLVCGNDVVALGALNAARELSIRVPDELSVVGFDDLPASRWALIQLTTVAFDLDAMARRAAQLMVQRIAGEAGAAVRPRRLPDPAGPAGDAGGRAAIRDRDHVAAAIMHTHTLT